jgi:hypothetical protein
VARYKHIDTGPRLLPVDLRRQLRPGTFEYALALLLDHEIDLSHFDKRYRNDEGGAAPYPPGMLLQVFHYAYSQGLLSSRAIHRTAERLPRVRPPRTLSAPPRQDEGEAGSLPHRPPPERPAQHHRTNANDHRLGRRPPLLRSALRDGGAGLGQHPAQQADESLHAARPSEGGRTVEDLLPGAQHRKDRAERRAQKTLSGPEGLAGAAATRSGAHRSVEDAETAVTPQ